MSAVGASEPFEHRGQAAQVGTGSGLDTLTSPGPSITQSSPGLATAATRPPPNVPTLPSDDPGAMALLLAKLAGEMFGGASVVPVPSPQQLLGGAGMAAPASPGIFGFGGVGPQLVPASPAGSQPMPGDVMATAMPGGETHAMPATLATSGAPSGGGFGGSSLSAIPFGAGFMSAPIPTGGLSSAFAPAGSTLGDPTRTGDTRVATEVPRGLAQTTAPHDPRGADARSGSIQTNAPKGGAQTGALPAAAPGITSGGMPPPAPPPSWITPANPFGTTPELEHLQFGPAKPGMPPLPDVFRIPMIDATSSTAAPSYLPEPGALGLESRRSDAVAAPETLHEITQPPVRDLGGSAFDPYRIRRDFPILDERVHGKRLVWLDNAATTQKPRAVIDRLTAFYEHENSNIHRGAHTLAARATDAYESARETSRRFLNAPSAQDIIFVRGATEGINLVAQSWGRRNVGEGDEIVITHLEHHANIVPWQMLCADKGARLRVAPVDDRGDVILEEYEKLLGPRTRVVAFPHVSNALGTITPAHEMVAMAHRHGARVLVDGAQAVSHLPVDVQALDCDWYVFSGHKVFAPTGIGVVYGKREVLEGSPPWQGGGNMIQDVTFERTVYQPPPFRFEAGTGNIADAAGLGAALEYVMRIGMHVIDRYEHDLVVYATEHLLRVPGLRMIGTSPHKAGVLSFVLDGQRTEDVGAALDKDGIAVRSGHHCAQPILRRFGVESSVRASLAFYNVCEDIDALIEALMRLQAGR